MTCGQWDSCSLRTEWTGHHNNASCLAAPNPPHVQLYMYTSLRVAATPAASCLPLRSPRLAAPTPFSSSAQAATFSL